MFKVPKLCINNILKVCRRPPDKSAYVKIIFLISEAKHKLWVFKKRIDETVLLSTQNTC